MNPKYSVQVLITYSEMRHVPIYYHSIVCMHFCGGIEKLH